MLRSFLSSLIIDLSSLQRRSDRNLQLRRRSDLKLRLLLWRSRSDRIWSDLIDRSFSNRSEELTRFGSEHRSEAAERTAEAQRESERERERSRSRRRRRRRERCCWRGPHVRPGALPAQPSLLARLTWRSYVAAAGPLLANVSLPRELMWRATWTIIHVSHDSHRHHEVIV